MTELAVDRVYDNFYKVDRLAMNMSDGGGPFGFDIHFALEIDYLIKKYNIKTFVETGTNAGDTTYYMAKTYPDIQIITSEIDPYLFTFSSERLKKFDNVHTFFQSSEKTIDQIADTAKNPLYYLDAHWYEYWPVLDEIENIKSGVVCIGDANINDRLYSFDAYDDMHCDIDLIKDKEKSTPVYYNNSFDLTQYKYPCLQNIRRSGRMYFCKNIQNDYMKESKYFRLAS